MKIFEIMWLVAAAIALFMAITRAANGLAYGNYIYITIFTTGIAIFMYIFKKRNRKYLQEYYKKQENLHKKETSEKGNPEKPA
jgi:hypothetical protein